MAKTAFAFGAWPPRCLPGWHWPNMSHGYRVYRGLGGLSQADFAVPVGFAQAGATSLTLAGLGHEASARYTYVVRPVCGNGWIETPDQSCAVELETDASGQWTGQRPDAVEWLDAAVGSGGDIHLRWRWRRAYGADEPADFALYCAAAPDITPGSPQATVAYAGEGEYSHTFSLADGQSYWFAVTARSGGGVESHLSRVVGPYLADATAPAPPSVVISKTF